MVRVATLLKKFRAGIDDVVARRPAHASSSSRRCASARRRCSTTWPTCWQELLRPLLDGEGIRFLEPADYTPEIARVPGAATSSRTIWPVLTPLAFDPGHPFPYISNLSKNFAVVVRHGGRTKFARVKVPDMLPRFIALPDAAARRRPTAVHAFVFIEDVIRANIQELFPGTQVEERAPVPHRPRHGHRDPGRRGRRPARDRGPQPASSCATARCRCCRSRPSMPRRVLDILVENFEVDEDVVLRTSDRLGFADWMELTALHRPALKDPPFVAARICGPGRTPRRSSTRSATRTARPPPVRVVRVGRDVPARGGEGPARRRDQDDAVPHRRRTRR